MPQLYADLIRRCYWLVLCLIVGTVSAAMAQTYQLPARGQLSYTTCSGAIYDDGGPNGQYSSAADGTVTLRPAVAGYKIRLDFTSFSLESGFDFLEIYDGADVSAPQIGRYDQQNPGTVYATNSAGVLTLRFTSDYSDQYSGFAATISCVTTVPQADLAIQGASAQPLAVVPGSTLNTACTIYNLAGVAAQSSSVGYYLSTDATLSQNDVLLGNTAGGALSSNQSTYRYSTCSVPATVTPGSYYLLFVADYQNVVNESNEANNVASISLNVIPPSIDLVVQQTSVGTSSAAPGSVLSLSCTVANQGNATAPYSSVGYYFSNDAVLDAADQLMGTTFGGQLQPSGRDYRQVAANVPPNTTPGTYYVLFVADYQNVVSESNETNNAVAMPLVVALPTVDFEVISAQLNASSVAAGTSVYCSAAIYNRGNVTSPGSTLGIYLSADATLSQNDQLLTTNSVSQIAAAQSATIYTQFTLPSSTAPGVHYILFVADHQNTVTESNEANNVRAQPLTVVAPTVDLIHQQLYLYPAVATPGAPMTTSSYVYNAGNVSAASSNIGYYLSTDNALSTNDVLLGTSSGGQLAPSTYTNNRQGNFTLPGSVTPGSYYVLAVIDYQDVVAETNENNNMASALLTVVAPSVDLTLSSPSLSRTSGAAGAQLGVSVTIYNRGNTGSASSNVGYYLSTDASLSSNDQLLSNTSGGFLSANDYSIRYSSITIPTGTTAGSYYVLYVADYTGAVSETNEANNVVALAFTVTAPFAGTVVPFSGTTSITTCGTTVYDHGGTNNYDNNANGTLVINPGTVGSKVRLAFSLLEVETCCDQLIVYDGPNTYAPVLGRYTSNPGTLTATNSSGALTLQFVSDGSATYEGFQAAVSCVTGGSGPGTLPDLVPLAGSATPTAVIPGSTLSLNSSILNQGGTVAASSTMHYYFSTNTTLDTYDQLLGTSTGGALQPGQTAVRGGQFWLPGTAPTGTFYILHVADASNQVVEGNENNNVAFTMLQVAYSLPDLVVRQASLSHTTIGAGGVLTVTGEVHNQGSVLAGASATGYFLSSDATYSPDDILLGNSQMGSLSAGSTQALSTPLVVLPNTPSGNYYLLFVADYGENVGESNETNNVMARAVAVSVVQSSRDERLAGLALRVFPNPTAQSRHLTVQLDGSGQGKIADLRLYDALGREVAQQRLPIGPRQSVATFDVKHFSPGVYVLRLTGEGLNATRRVVVE